MESLGRTPGCFACISLSNTHKLPKSKNKNVPQIHSALMSKDSSQLLSASDNISSDLEQIKRERDTGAGTHVSDVIVPMQGKVI